MTVGTSLLGEKKCLSFRKIGAVAKPLLPGWWVGFGDRSYLDFKSKHVVSR